MKTNSLIFLGVKKKEQQPTWALSNFLKEINESKASNNNTSVQGRNCF